MSFHIAVSRENLENFYKIFHARQGTYLLGKLPLPSPLKQMRLFIVGHQDQYSHAGIISLFVQNTLAQYPDVLDVVAKRAERETGYECHTVRDLLMVTDAEGDIEYLVRKVYPDEGYNPLVEIIRSGIPESKEKQRLRFEIHVSSGSDPDATVKERFLRNPAEFVDELYKFFRMVTLTVESLYAAFESEIPTIRFPWSPVKMPSAGTNTSNEALQNAIEFERPNLSLDEIGGLEDAKEEIESMAYALQDSELYREWGTRPVRGLLLYGPPGTGKTMLARVLASLAKSNFYNVKCTDILSSMHAESEQNVQRIFDIAVENAPSIVFFDEIDALAVRRDHAGSEIGRRIVTVILQNMNGLKETKGVAVVAATNRLDTLDPAVLRPERFDKWVKVDLPHTESRRTIFLIHMEKARALGKRQLFASLDFPALLAKTEGMSGADIAEIIRRTLEKKARNEKKTGARPGLVDTDDLLREISLYEHIVKDKNEARGGQYL